MLCDVEVTLIIHVRDKHRLITYESNPEKSVLNEMTTKILQNNVHRAQVEKYTNHHTTSFGVNIDDETEQVTPERAESVMT